MSNKEEEVQRAKLAEQAERYVSSEAHRSRTSRAPLL